MKIDRQLGILSILLQKESVTGILKIYVRLVYRL